MNMLGVSYGVDFCPSFNSINSASAWLHALYMTPSHAWSWPKDPAAGWILEFGADVHQSPHMSSDSAAFNARNPWVASNYFNTPKL